MFSNEPTLSSNQELDQKYQKLEKIAFRLCLSMIFLAPLFFVPTPYLSLSFVKTIVIVVGVFGSVAIYAFVAFKQKKLTLPPSGILWVSMLVVTSLIVSTLVSGHIGKSLFGQGFEVGSASFIVLGFLSALVVYKSLVDRPERAILVYVGMVTAFFVLYLFHALRFVFGVKFATLGILGGLTSTVLGNWYEFGIMSVFVAIILLGAIIFLPLSSRIKYIYWILAILAVFCSLVVASSIAWGASALVFFVLSIYLYKSKSDEIVWFKKISWIPVFAFIVMAIFVWNGKTIAVPVVETLNAGYSELVLPWQATLDVAAGSLKNNPLFGIGPNRFSQAYIMYKPLYMNTGGAWSAEFNSGFGMIPTFFVTQGLVGGIAWILFFVFFGIAGVRALRFSMSDSKTGPHSRFILVSSFCGAIFLWLVTLVYSPSHVLVLYAFVVTGIFISSAVAGGYIVSLNTIFSSENRLNRFFPMFMGLLMAILVVWGLVYIKKFGALFYFGSGVKHLSAENNPEKADADFKKALAFDPYDVYWQARAEAGIIKANNLITNLSLSGTDSSASSSQAIATEVIRIINEAVTYSRNAIVLDPDNYYNRLSEARVSRLATNLRMAQGYENAIQAYGTAIQINPLNPSLYLDLAQLHASQNKLDEALRAIGGALQVKNNYIDAIFMLSQISAAQGNLKDAITAVGAGIKLNPENPLLYFQLGLLQYNNKEYKLASEALLKAVEISPNYANAHYFLGLSYSRLGKNDMAIDEFEELAKNNPDNKEVQFILTNLKSGKSPFTDAKPPVTSTPEKRSKLPLQEKQN